MISVKALAHEIRQSRTSAVAALNEHLDVIDEMEGEINAFNIVILIDEVLKFPVGLLDILLVKVVFDILVHVLL